MAEWFVEGLLNRLLNPSEPVAVKFLEQATVYIIPNVVRYGFCLHFCYRNVYFYF